MLIAPPPPVPGDIGPPSPESWLIARPEGLHCAPGDFFIDPSRAVERALITHGHADHARPGNGRVIATRETLAIMAARYGAAARDEAMAIALGERLRVGEVTVSFHPAGHVLGSAQIRMEYRGRVIVVSGDYKRQADPTCVAFEPVPCDVFVTEATFGLPVFRHPPAAREIARLLTSVTLFPERAHLVGVYALGKAQRVIAQLRAAGYDRPIFLHGAMRALCDLYVALGVPLGPLVDVANADKAALTGAIVLAPPGAGGERWARRLPEPLIVQASGWMRVRQRARQRGAELPLVISDHADWDELNRTIDEVAAPEVWVTHGREEALVHAVGGRGKRARALALIGFEEED